MNNKMFETSDTKIITQLSPKRIIYNRIYTCQLGSVMSAELYIHACVEVAETTEKGD